MTLGRASEQEQVEQITGGYKVLDATGQALAYVSARDTRTQAEIAEVLNFDEARTLQGALLLQKQG